MAATPDTIVLIHRCWVTPRSWEDWQARYESRGYRIYDSCIPRLQVEVEALKIKPTPMVEVTVPAVVEHLESVVSQIEPAPILMGHSASNDLHAAADRSRLRRRRRRDQLGADEGVKRLPLSQIRSSFSVLKKPANRHKAVGFTFEQWRYVFTNTFSEEEARRLLQRYHIPASGRVFWSSALANIHPGPRRDARELQEPQPGAAALHLWQRGSPHAPVDPALERKALRGGGNDHQGQGVRRAARTSCTRRPAGRRSPTTPSTGRSSTQRGPGHGLGNDDAVAVLRRGGGSHPPAS